MDSGDLEHDIRGAKTVILYLCRSGLQWYRGYNGESRKAWNDTYKAIGGRFRICTSEEEVDEVVLGKDDDGNVTGEMNQRHILLAPPTKQPIVCLLGLRWQLSTDVVEMTLYLHLFGRSQLPGQKTWHRGYRLELPHRTGAHTYPHVQPVVSEGWRHREAVPFTEQGVPSNFPAFPLRGHNLTTLCAALAIALRASDLENVVNALKGHRTQNDVLTLLA